MSVSILYEANEVCNRDEALALREAIRVSILYEANEVCNLNKFKTVDVRVPVSILYEANEVCNVVLRPRGLVRRPFQSSTRLTRFATPSPPPTAQVVLVSILYEANEVCNPYPVHPLRGSSTSFNPLRG